MEKESILKIQKELNLKERILFKIFTKTFYKFYRRGMVDCFNFYNKNV